MVVVEFVERGVVVVVSMRVDSKKAQTSLSSSSVLVGTLLSVIAVVVLVVEIVEEQSSNEFIAVS